MCSINLIFILIFFYTINPQCVLTQIVCKTHEFHCDNGDCLNKTLVCDNTKDCSDGSDELHCECREPEFFLCKNSMCISHTFVCDNENDCGDYSDEEDCKDFKTKLLSNSTCDKDHWQCLDKICIPSDFVCNGESDCLDGSDETIGCTLNITCDGYKCKNGHCIVQEWKCDGNNDCGDNSDEDNCESLTNFKDCQLDGKTFLCKDNKTCIKITNVCDGKEQCPDGSDESRNCQLPCSALNCPDKCIHLPNGPKCTCSNGYFYNEKSHSCDDINECGIYGICDQKCRNTVGSYECYCSEGFSLKSDKWSCISNNNDSIMFFSTKNEIRAFMLKQEKYYPVANDLKQVVGVVYNGEYLYWTDIFSEHESIVRCLKDGSNRELIVTAGLGAPEDLDIDWITGNIYFTDAERQHIGVCNSNGTHCTILINKDIQKPRGIALDPQNGEMYWTDWGKHPEIAKSLMDGAKDISFVSENIHWPNGLAIDYYNDRLYWTDAKIQTIESINLDGTDRRIILDGILKHPYSINIYEDRLYWSDWATHSIHSCNKFTGKNHHTVIKEEKDFIYGIHIYDRNLYDQKKRSNPCMFSFCSDLCLLSGTSYTCTCPQDKELNMDGHTCKEVEKKQNLILAAQNLIIRIEHQLLGKHEVTALPIIVRNVGALAYNSINNTLYISDIGAKKIISLDLHSGDFEEVPVDDDGDDLGTVTAMDYDIAGNNLYWCDTEKRTVELFNFNTMSRKILLHDFSGEIPESIALVPEIGVMFIAFKKSNQRESHIDRFYMDGTHRTHPIETGLFGPIDLLYDQETHRIFFSDAATGNIETTSIDGDDRHGFRSLQTSPISIASLKTDLFWVNQYSHRLYWADKFNNDNGYNKKIALDLPDVIEQLQIVSILPKIVNNNPCHINNGGCSHICLSIEKRLKCDCPNGMILGGKHNKTCTKIEHCAINEFYCGKSNQCILHELRCNGRSDCKYNEDEENCQQIVDCGDRSFKCTNGDCIDSNLRCNHHYDCQDKSDEYNCEYSDTSNNCPPYHFRCDNGYCISLGFVCDKVHDCLNGEDELNCEENVCNTQQFRCTTGTCIPKSWECDHEYDCPDYSDEHTNCTQCSSGLFKCNNGKCIDKSFVCDNENDCGDHSDENDCDVESGQLNCPPDMFQCKSNRSLCLPITAVCNKTAECPHLEDEQGCSDCHIEEFTCNNKKCIPTQWLCDHTNDCGDNSDEEPALCVHSTVLKNVQHLVPCDHQNSYRCRNGLCIDLMAVCNGESDCYDDSDEEGACTTSCQVDSNPCSQDCHRTPNGPLCRCKQGYRLLNDGHSCEDINECAKQPPVCSQICNNQIGSYVCDCYNGFILRSDKKSCKAEGPPMSLIFTVDNQIRELSQVENSLKLLYQEDIPKISGLDIIVQNNTIYFTIEETGTIHFINYLTKQRQYMKNIGKPTKLTIDWLTNNIYFINNDIDKKSISICNFNEHKCSQFLTVDLHRQVTSLIVDPINKILFYSLVNWRMFNSPNYMIYKINLDGSNWRILINTTGYISGLSYDYNKKHLYYLDQHLGLLKRINYDGTMEVLIKSNLTRPIGLDFYENHVYLSSIGGYIIKCKLYDIDSTYSCDNFRLNSLTTDLFVIVQQSKQRLDKNQCNNHNCQHLCLPTGQHYKCLCDHGTIINSNETCDIITETRESSDDHKPLLQVYKPLVKKPLTNEELNQQHAHSVVSKIASITIPLGLICLIASAYYFYKKHYKISKTTDFNTISFHNSGYGLHYNDDDDHDNIGNKKINKNQLGNNRHEFVNPIVLGDDHNDGDHQSTNTARSSLLVDV